MIKFLTLFLVLSLGFVFASCNPKNTDSYAKTDVNVDSAETESEIKVDDLSKLKNKFVIKEKWNVELPLENIKELSSRYQVFITNDGYLYQYSDKIYKDSEKHYRRMNENIKFKSIGGCQPITMDNRYWGDYRFPISEYKFSTIEKELLMFEDFAWSNIRDIKDETPLKIAKQGDKVFLLDSQNSILQLLNDFDEKEKIIGIYNNGIIKTDKNYYFADITNKDELKKYADATPVYGLVTDVLLTAEYNNIQYFDGETAIFKDDKEHIYINYLK